MQISILCQNLISHINSFSSSFQKIYKFLFNLGQTSACPEGRFYCGSVNNMAPGLIPSMVDFNGRRSSVLLPTLGICVSERVRCDGVVNCPDGRDEFPSQCNNFMGLSLLFLKSTNQNLD